MQKEHRLLPAIITAKDGKRYTLENGYIFENGDEYLTVYGNESGNAYILKDGKVAEGPAWIDEIRKKMCDIYVSNFKGGNKRITYISPAEEWEAAGTELTSEEYALRNKKNEQKKALYAALRKAEINLAAWNSIHWNTKKDGSAFAVVSRNFPKGVWISGEISGASLFVSIPAPDGGYSYDRASYHVYNSDGFSLDSFDGVLKAVEKAKEHEAAQIEICRRKLESIDKEIDTAAALFAPLEKYFNEGGMNCITEVKRVLKGIFKNYRYDY
jgi:hypothetical protein